MKTLFFAIIAFFTLSAQGANAQSKNSSKKVETSTIKVEGTCGDCKKRIEDAAYVSGVKRAEWNKVTKELKVSYNTQKTDLTKIEQSIANAGHNAGDVKASNESYDKLPECCKYKSNHDH